MADDPDLKETGIVVFGSSPLEFCLLLPVKSGDVYITPDQFLDHLKNKVNEWDMHRGDPHSQVCPPTVFKAGKNYLLRAGTLAVNTIQVTLPHPIDIVFGKLHRLEDKDYRAVDALLKNSGRPTCSDLEAYMSDNPDIFELPQAQLDKLIENIEMLWVYLEGSAEGLDVRGKFLNKSLAEKTAVWKEGGGNLSQARRIVDSDPAS